MMTKSKKNLFQDDVLWRTVCLQSANFEMKEQEESQMTWKEIFTNRMTCSLQEHSINIILIGERTPTKASTIRSFLKNQSTTNVSSINRSPRVTVSIDHRGQHRRA